MECKFIFCKSRLDIRWIVKENPSPSGLSCSLNPLLHNLAKQCEPSSAFFSALLQEEVSRLAALQPQVELLERQLDELKAEKEGDKDSPAFLDADIDAFKEHYHKVLEDLRARERQLQLGRRRHRIYCRICFQTSFRIVL